MRKIIDIITESDEINWPDWLDQNGEPIPDRVNQKGRPHNWADDTVRALVDIFHRDGLRAAEAEWKAIQERDTPTLMVAHVVSGRFHDEIRDDLAALPPMADEYPENRIWKSTWTEWQDRDGIFVQHPGSNSVYVGFSHQTEAERFAQDLGPSWRVVRNGAYRDDLDDDGLLSRHDIRTKRRLYGMTNLSLDHTEAIRVWNDLSKLARYRIVDSLDHTYHDKDERHHAIIQYIMQNIDSFR